MFGEAFQEQSSHDQTYIKNWCMYDDYGSFVLEGPHQTFKLYMGFIEFSRLYTAVFTNY